MPSPSDRSIPARFARIAAAHPDAPALASGETRLTYAALDVLSDGIAARLLARGIGPEDRVALAIPRSVALVVAHLAVVKAGAAYVPLDLDQPAQRRAFVLRDVRPALVLTGGTLDPACEGWPTLEVDLHETSPSAASFPGIRPDDLAYVTYTSGSTGVPKGVAVPHRAVLRLVDRPGYVELGPGERVLHLAPAAFDAATLEIWGPLLNGGEVVVGPERPSLAEIADVLVREGITTAWFTAGLFHQLVDEQLPALAGVRQVLAGGDVVSPGHARRFLAGTSGRLVNGYGPTENTTFTCCHAMRAGEDPGDTVPIGTPIGGTRCHVLDESLREVPDGEVGELCASGEGLARGYWGRPGLTAASFLPDPFSPFPGGRMYRTGDRVRLRADGVCVYLGRADGQGKIRGHRVEVGEVEAAIVSHPGVREAVVAIDRAGGEARIVAWVVGETGLSGASVREHVRDRLPTAMVPAAVVCLPALPRTPLGKIDRAALPAVPPDGDSGTPPRTPLEAALAGIWARALGRDSVGVDADFFAIGGHSLAATRIVARIDAELGVRMSLRTFFEAATVAALATRIENGTAGDDGPRRLSRDPGAAIPLSEAQERLWFLDRLLPDSPLYTIPYALRVPPDLDVPALDRAIRRLVARHEVLRTALVVRDGLPVQEVRDADVQLRVVTTDDLDRALRAEACAPFRLDAPPLLRATLFRGRDASVLLLTVHHVAADAWSLEVIAREVAASYAGEDLPDPPLRYADFATWQRRRNHDVALAWWRTRLAPPLPPAPLPFDRPRPDRPTGRGTIVERRLPPVRRDAVHALARAAGVTPQVVLLTAFAATLARLGGRDAVLVGIPVSGRTHGALEGLVGFFVNTLAIRVERREAPTFERLVRHVRDRVLEAVEHDVSFARVVEEVRADRAASLLPLVGAMFAHHDEPAPAPRLGGPTEVVPIHTGTAKADLTLTVEVGNGLRCTLEYATDLFDAPTAERVIGAFGTLLEAALARPDRALDDLPLIPAAEQSRVETFGRGGPARWDGPVHAIVARVAARRPDAVAIVGPNGTVSYAELDARADRLARRLRAAGVGGEDRVGVLMDRSAAMVVSLLAILRAGGAFVPIDPAWPDARVAYALADAGVRVVLTDAPGRVPEGLLVLDPVDADPRDDAVPLPVGTVHPLGIAYVIYTSGSTGTPKGVAIPHAGLANLVAWYVQTLGLGPESRATHLAGLGFDATILEVWPTLAAGAALHLVPDAVRMDPTRLGAWMRERGITHTFLPTPLFEQLPHDGPGPLRLVNVGGDRLHAAPPVGTPYTLVNSYGPTEITVEATAAVVPPGAPGLPSIGRPLPGAVVRVLDAALGLVPPGGVGEICIGGIGVARGYLGRPGLTAERFVPDPYATEPGARLYRTGDRGRWREDGELVFLGRDDAQVKIRGTRIELGEIEAVLGRHPAVREVVVVPAAGPRLVAYVATDTVLDPGGLRAHVAASLPDAMVPAAFVALPALPRTTSGKVDRAALPAPKPPTPLVAATPLQERVASIWCEILGLSTVDLDANFFDLGGHSLLVMQLQRLLRERLGADVPVVELFARGTVRAQADLLVGPAPATPPTRPPTPRPAPEPGRAGLLALRQRRSAGRDLPPPKAPEPP